MNKFWQWEEWSNQHGVQMQMRDAEPYEPSGMSYISLSAGGGGALLTPDFVTL